MKAIALILAMTIGSAMTSAQAASDNQRWCVIKSSDNARQCIFARHRDCMKAISDGSGVCVPNEVSRGNNLEK